MPATGSRAGAIYLFDKDGALERAAAQAVQGDGADLPVTDNTPLPDEHAVRRAIKDSRTIVDPLPAGVQERVRAWIKSQLSAPARSSP